VNPAVLSSLISSGASVHPSGFIGGGQIGYNWQTSFVVFGVEADAQGLTGQASPIVTPLTFAGLAPGDFVSNSAKPEFLATFRGRIGVTPFGGPHSALFYATGGGAWGTVKVTDTFGAVGGTAISSATATENRSGWTAGGGIEFPLINNITFKAEYLYVDLGHFNQTTASIVGFPATDITFTHFYTENIVRAGLNYQFH
jgi:outer membrane immunogenic protein